jgi:hypothetical protein
MFWIGFGSGAACVLAGAAVAFVVIALLARDEVSLWD